MALGGGGPGDGIDLGPVGGGGKDLFLVRFSICINHRSVGTKTGATILLNMARFLAETADNGFRFPMITISVEATKVRFERRLPVGSGWC